MSKSSPTSRVTTRLAVGRPWEIKINIIFCPISDNEGSNGRGRHLYDDEADDGEEEAKEVDEEEGISECRPGEVGGADVTGHPFTTQTQHSDATQTAPSITDTTYTVMRELRESQGSSSGT